MPEQSRGREADSRARDFKTPETQFSSGARVGLAVKLGEIAP